VNREGKTQVDSEKCSDLVIDSRSCQHYCLLQFINPANIIGFYTTNGKSVVRIKEKKRSILVII
jgi:hypothetical protein